MTYIPIINFWWHIAFRFETSFFILGEIRQPQNIVISSYKPINDPTLISKNKHHFYYHMYLFVAVFFETNVWVIEFYYHTQKRKNVGREGIGILMWITHSFLSNQKMCHKHKYIYSMVVRAWKTRRDRKNVVCCQAQNN